MTKPASRIDDALIDQLLAGRPQGPALFREGGLIGELKKRLAEHMLAAELDVHLADPDRVAAGNHRKGAPAKTVQSAEERAVRDIPRDRHG
jgi:putative transposase